MTLVAAAAASGCESSAPASTDAAVVERDAPGSDAPSFVDAARSDAGPRTCETSPTDFPASATYTCSTVRSALETSPNAFPYVVEPPGASARAVAFEQMRTNGYFDYTHDPEPADFAALQDLYIGGGSGLASRVGRRFDPHFPTPDLSGLPDMTRLCQLEDTWRANVELCVGPSTLTPTVLEAIARGQTGDASEPSRNYAARIEAAILWFLHVSTYKETLTCAIAYPGGDGGAGDCDAAWGYYTGGADRASDGIGYSALVQALEPATHDRIWDGLLAVRCWREMDSSDPAAQDPNAPTLSEPEVFATAHAQEDVALQRGIVVVLIDRLHRFQETTGLERAAHLEFLRTIFAPLEARTLTDTEGNSTDYPARPSLFDHTMRAVSTSDADFIASEIVKDADAIDVDGIIARLDAAFPCP